MRNIWIIWMCVTVAFLTGERIRVTAESLTLGDDLYLDDQSSGDYPVDDDDDDDFASGSGSGEGPVETVNVKTVYHPPKAEPTQEATKDLSSRTETISGRYTPKVPARTEAPLLLTEEPSSTDEVTSTTGAPQVLVDEDKPFRVHSENILQRTEVLAAVIAGGVIGFLFAIFLILLLVYRMRKKDEGSYDLGERKPMSTTYQKAPTKEFYA
ncbi:syndecan-2-B-like [Anguilla rostrata]|uniref:syndecan-2-B-like n=1 Tax=Anguilla rostrata TaxID=7938 RepID=UPI0030D36DAA